MNTVTLRLAPGLRCRVTQRLDAGTGAASAVHCKFFEDGIDADAASGREGDVDDRSGRGGEIQQEFLGPAILHFKWGTGMQEKRLGIAHRDSSDSTKLERGGKGK